MKISDLISEIVVDAEWKFGILDEDGNREHLNDCISVWIFYDTDNAWQVGLERPSKEQLECGEVHDCRTMKSSVSRLAFYTEGTTLLKALRGLQQKVNDAHETDFPS